ncbi:MAG: hypothetical protein GKR86_00060 [Ilumatobacter sp.]|nr:hypothetical protein [Ilumatobacter sp.]
MLNTGTVAVIVIVAVLVTWNVARFEWPWANAAEDRSYKELRETLDEETPADTADDAIEYLRGR